MKNIIKSIIAFVFIISLCGCMSDEEKKNLDKITKEGLNYIEKKYNKKFEKDYSKYIVSSVGMFVSESEDIQIMLMDGTRVVYDNEEKLFYDDYQAELIVQDITDKLWKQLESDIQPVIYKNPEDKLYFNLRKDKSCSGSFFHEYYDGNIESFAEKENIIVSYGQLTDNGGFDDSNLYVIVNNKLESQQKVSKINNTFSKYFRKKHSYQHLNLNIAIVTQELYNSIVSNDTTLINVGLDGCFAEGNPNDFSEQNFIKVYDGIYITSDVSNIKLNEGDIFLKKATNITQIELQNDLNEISGEYYKYIVNNNIPILEVVFDDEFIKKYKQVSTRDDFYCYFKVVPEELNISINNNLYSTRKTDYNFTSEALDIEDKYDYALEIIFPTGSYEDNYYWFGEKIKR